MTVAIHQPNFLPWMGYFHKLYLADMFVILDDVQFVKRDFINRTHIMYNNEKQLISVPTTKEHRHALIKDIQLSVYGVWKRTFFERLRHTYRSAPHYQKVKKELEYLMDIEHNSLMKLNVALLEWAINKLKINVAIEYSSKFSVKSTKTGRLVELCSLVNGHTYITGIGSSAYINEWLFRERDITVDVIDFGKKWEPISVLNYFMYSKKTANDGIFGN